MFIFTPRTNAGAGVAASCTPINFRQAPEYATGGDPRSVTIADFDGDGKPDLAVAYVVSDTGSGISLLRNDGAGGFSGRQDIAMGPSVLPAFIYSHDLDVDGKPDLVVTHAFSNFIFVYRNISPTPGQIMFAPREQHAVGGEQGRHLRFGDIDGDGSDDIVVAAPSGNSVVSVLRNLSVGTGSIVLAPKVDTAFSSIATVLTLGDFDGDGKLDVAAGGNGARREFRILQNTSTGPGSITFAVSSAFAVPDSSTMAATADLDSDGKPDIVVSNSRGTNNDRSITVLRNASTGPGSINFAPGEHFPSGDAPFAVIAQDLNGDGKKDLVTVNNNGNDVSVLENASTGPGSLAFAPRKWDFGAGIDASHLAMGDLNADGKPDFVTANSDGNNVSVLLAKGGQAIDFFARKDYLTRQTSGVTSLTSGDFDNDGDKDIAATFDKSIPGFIGFSVYLNDGTGHFPTRVDVPIEVRPYFLTSADLDGDGLADVALLSDVGVHILRNSSSPGNIAFTSQPFLTPYFSSQSILLVDLDADGKRDVVFGQASQFQPNQAGTAYVFRNTTQSPGAISFSQVQDFTFGIAGTRTRFQAADIDLDGKPDLVHGMLATKSFLRVERNTSVGNQISFEPHDFVHPDDSLGSFVLNDLDLDGKRDLLATSDSDLSFFKNTSVAGAASFAPPSIFPFIFAQPVLSGDFDNDEKVDVLLSNDLITGAFVTVGRNITQPGGAYAFERTAKFAFSSNSNGSANFTSIIADDFNNDGKLDVATGLYSSWFGAISVLLNDSCAASSFSAPFDFDGDGKTDIGIFRPIAGASEWWVNRSSTGQTFALQFGSAGDAISPADYTGDGKTDIAFFRPASGEWFVLRSEDFSFFALPFGTNGDVPVPADYDADGKADFAVFRPSSSTWFISQSSGAPTRILQFGTGGDQPVVADYDGDGRADVGVFRPAASGGEWWIDRSSAGLLAVRFGAATDKAVQGDYTGDGKTDIAIWRPSTGEWYIVRSEDSSFFGFPFGASGDVPAPGDYDGDGKFDPTVFRPSNATWFIARTTAGTQIVQFGATGDRPLPNSFVP